MKKLMVYPFNKLICQVARHHNLLQGYELSAINSPKGYGYEGKDISFVDGGDITDLKITSNFEADLNKSDCILFTQSTYESVIDFYADKIKYALEQEKEVLITKELHKELQSKYMDILSDTKVLEFNPVAGEDFSESKKYLKEINVPIIILFSMGKFCNGLSTEVLLTEKFKKDGYRVSSISSSRYSGLFGIHPLPEYIYKNEMSIEDKIINFNWYVENIINTEDADLLIIEIEEAILPYSDRLLNDFGVIPYIVSNSVKADIGIINLYYGVADKEYFKNLKNFSKYKYDIEVEYFNISNTKIVIDEFNALHPVSYISVDRETVIASMDDLYQGLQFNLFNTLDEKSSEDVYQKIMNELSGNPAVVSIW